jgi:hypothetical protein
MVGGFDDAVEHKSAPARCFQDMTKAGPQIGQRSILVPEGLLQQRDDSWNCGYLDRFAFFFFP